MNKNPGFVCDLMIALRNHGVADELNTSDHILARYIISSLTAFDIATRRKLIEDEEYESNLFIKGTPIEKPAKSDG